MPENRENQVLEPIKNAKIVYENFKAFGTNYLRNLQIQQLERSLNDVINSIQFLQDPTLISHYSGLQNSVRTILEHKKYEEKQKKNSLQEESINLLKVTKLIKGKQLLWMFTVCFLLTIIYSIFQGKAPKKIIKRIKPIIFFALCFFIALLMRLNFILVDFYQLKSLIQQIRKRNIQKKEMA